MRPVGCQKSMVPVTSGESVGAACSCHPHPTGPWNVQEARHVVAALDDESTAFRFLIRDRDAMFTRAFDDVWCSTDVEVICTPVRAPTANAVAERCSGRSAVSAWTGY
jgi:hypothetical protein